MKRTNQITTNYIMHAEDLHQRCQDVLACVNETTPGNDLCDFWRVRDNLDRAAKDFLLYEGDITTPEEAAAIQAYLKGEIK